MAEIPTNPGSYNDFVKNQGLEVGVEAFTLHSEALSSYRSALAEAQGVTLEDLHAGICGNLVQVDLPESA